MTDNIESNIQVLESQHDGEKENLVQGILDRSLTDDKGNNQLSSFYILLATPSLNSNISVLTDHLILTSAATVTPHVLHNLNLSCIISAAPELPYTPLSDDDISYHQVDVIDSSSTNISRFFDEAADLIHQMTSLGGRTLIFCVAGVSRSASLCIAYLMKYHQLTLREAYDYVKMRRPRIKPNCGFFKQLIDYEKRLFMASSVKMVYNELVHMDIPDVYESEYRIVRRINRKFKDRCRQ